MLWMKAMLSIVENIARFPSYIAEWVFQDS